MEKTIYFIAKNYLIQIFFGKKILILMMTVVLIRKYFQLSTEDIKY